MRVYASITSPMSSRQPSLIVMFCAGLWSMSGWGGRRRHGNEERKGCCYRPDFQMVRQLHTWQSNVHQAMANPPHSPQCPPWSHSRPQRLSHLHPPFQLHFPSSRGCGYRSHRPRVIAPPPLVSPIECGPTPLLQAQRCRGHPLTRILRALCCSPIISCVRRDSA
jgi:hypothetical protein